MQASHQQSMDILQLLMGSSGVVLVVLIMLIGLSVVSWYIIGYKFFYLSRASSESVQFLETFWQSKRMDAIYALCDSLKRSPISQVFKAGYIELTKLRSGQARSGGGETDIGDLESIERALRREKTS